MLVAKAGPGARRADPERPAGLPGPPSADPALTRALARDRRRGRQGARPRPAGRTPRPARRCSRTCGSADVERADRATCGPTSSRSTRRRRWARDRPIPAHRARARRAQHPVVQHALARPTANGNRFFEWMQVGFEVFAQAAEAGFPTLRARAARRARRSRSSRTPRAVVLAGVPRAQGTREARVARARAARPGRAHRRARPRPTGSTPRSRR